MQRFGLALGGGSVFGYAHVGVLDALDQNGLRPDLIAGTSAGAIAASLYAFGVPPDLLRERFATMTWRQITDFVPGRLGLFRNVSLGELMDELLGPARIEDALIPLAIAATDIETGERVVLREGPVSEAVRASACIPGLYAPVEIDGRRLVDGGLLNNVPVDLLRDRASVVAGVSLMGGVPFKKVRSLAQVLINAASFALRESTRLETADQADIMIEPDLTGRASWSMDDLPGLLAAGRSGVEAALPAIRRALHEAQNSTTEPLHTFAQRLATHIGDYATDSGLSDVRTSAVRCEAGRFCVFTLATTAPVSVAYLISIWHQSDHLLVRIESSTTEERVPVPLHAGQLREADQAEGERKTWDAIQMDLQRILSTNA